MHPTALKHWRQLFRIQDGQILYDTTTCSTDITLTASSFAFFKTHVILMYLMTSASLSDCCTTLLQQQQWSLYDLSQLQGSTKMSHWPLLSQKAATILLPIFRPHRCGAIVAYCYTFCGLVCVSVRNTGDWWALEKRLNRSRCHLVCWLGWA